MAVGGALITTGAIAQARLTDVQGHAGNRPRITCARVVTEGSGTEVLHTTLAGVPAILRIPARVSSPLIILWHGFGPPASPEALMEALPLDGVPAVKVYLGLPLFGRRARKGGIEDLIQRQKHDFADLLFKPSVVGAANELPAVVAVLERRQCVAPRQNIDLFGFSAGGAAVLIALAQHHVPIDAAVILNASTGLTASVRALERVTKRHYKWTPAANALARATDAPLHASEIAGGRPPRAILILQGRADRVLTTQPAQALYAALLPYYGRSPDRLRLDLLPGVDHGWARGESTARIQRVVTAWFSRYP